MSSSLAIRLQICQALTFIALSVYAGTCVADNCPVESRFEVYPVRGKCFGKIVTTRNDATKPFFRSYVFTYHYGGEMLDALFATQDDHDHWFARLLSEPVTPSQIQAWTEG